MAQAPGGDHKHAVYATHTDGGDATRYGWPSLKGPDSRDHFQRYHKADQNTAQLRNWNGVNGTWMESNGSHKHDGSTGNQSRGHTHKMNIGSASGKTFPVESTGRIVVLPSL